MVKSLIGQLPDWREAACRTRDPELFFGDHLDKRDQLPPQIQAICDRCPVKEACLHWALTNKEKHGAWGGTTHRQRQKLLRKTDRARCPGCESNMILEEPNGCEICGSCGLSWQI